MSALFMKMKCRHDCSERNWVNATLNTFYCSPKVSKFAARYKPFIKKKRRRAQKCYHAFWSSKNNYEMPCTFHQTCCIFCETVDEISWTFDHVDHMIIWSLLILHGELSLKEHKISMLKLIKNKLHPKKLQNILRTKTLETSLFSYALS